MNVGYSLMSVHRFLTFIKFALINVENENIQRLYSLEAIPNSFHNLETQKLVL